MTSTETVLLSVFSSATVTGTITFLARTWVTERLRSSIAHEYHVKLEAYRAQLKSEGDVELERLRAALVVQTHASTKEFEYQRRELLRSIEEIYAALVECEVKVLDYASPWGPLRGDEREADRQEAALRIRDFAKALARRRLYLPKDIAEHLVELRNRLHSLMVDYFVSIERAENHPNADAWEKVIDASTKTIPEAKRVLEERFRTVLGSDDSEPVVAADAPATPARG